MLGGMRKAYASKGDDVTLTRWIKLPERHQTGHKTTPMPATAIGTRFKTRVLRVDQMAGLLVSGHSNVKLGRDVRKARFRGYWIYSLSLEERATCPASCQHWETCYGNAMPLAKRIDHRDPAFLPALEAEIDRLLKTKSRKGILIRLHALGDFYSLAYIAFWRRMLETHDRLAIFGYTAHPVTSVEGLAINRMNSERCCIRFSNGGRGHMSTVSIKDPAECPPDAFICPEQTDRTTCCATCGACWSTTKNVAFLEH